MPELSPQLEAKVERLLSLLKGMGGAAVAYSGGLDSAMLAKAAVIALGERAVAVTAVSPSLAEGELEEASRVAEQIGIQHQRVRTAEMQNAAYLANTPQRCYHCKLEMYGRICREAQRLGLTVVIDGGNRDDEHEHRPGARAARQLNVRSPLAECGFDKQQIRTVAAFWCLDVSSKAATPCLSSRIAYGEAITPERLAMVDRAERFLREHVAGPLRVRFHRDELARIEVPPEAIAAFAEPQFRQTIIDELKAAGFRYIAIDLQGFRSGSLNEMLTDDDLQPGGENNRSQ